MTANPNNGEKLGINDELTRELPFLSIVIVNWNSKDCVRDCLKSIYRYASDLHPEIIVVDGASYDGCGEMLATEFLNVIFVQSDENIGFGRCNNLGVEKATGSLLLLLNPDTEIQSGSLHTLIEEYQSLPVDSLLGARLLNSDGSLQKTSVHAAPTPLNQALGSNLLMRLFPRSNLWGTYEAYHSDTPTEVEAISGACMFLPTALFRKVGGFNPIYFMYAEDMDLCLKIRRHSAHVYHVPDCLITHHGGRSSSEQPNLFSISKMRDALYQYFCYNFSLETADRYRKLLTFVAILKMLLFLPIGLFRPNRLKKFIHILEWSFRQRSTGVLNSNHRIFPSI